MKAAVIRGSRRLDIEDVPRPEPGPEDALVHLRAMPICGSDLHGFQGVIPQRRPVGLIMGHEAAGQVIEVGRNVSGVQAGDRVAIDPQLNCGSCSSCRRGLTHLCDDMRLIGSAMRGFLHGANAEYIAVPGGNLHRLPDGLSYLQGGMAEPVGNAVHVSARAGVKEGSVVAVIGAGAIGLLAIQAAKAFGADRVIASDLRAVKLDLARQLGADYTLQADDTYIESVRELTHGEGVDIAIECVGYEETYRSAIAVLSKRGTLAALGYVVEDVKFPMRTLIFREISVIGSTGFNWSVDPAFEFLESGVISVEPLITHTFDLQQAQAAYEAAESHDAVKVVLTNE